MCLWIRKGTVHHSREAQMSAYDRAGCAVSRAMKQRGIHDAQLVLPFSPDRSPGNGAAHVQNETSFLNETSLQMLSDTSKGVCYQ